MSKFIKEMEAIKNEVKVDYINTQIKLYYIVLAFIFLLSIVCIASC